MISNRQPMRTAAAGLLAMIAAIASSPSHAQQALSLEAKIPLGQVRGRIDHLAIDLKRNRLFVAELGNDSVGVVDIAARKVVHRITGLDEPQGVGYVASTDTVYVANGGDGAVRLFAGEDFASQGVIQLGDDADNVRVDEASNEVVVGHDKGALAIIDPKRRAKIADIPLKAHPEGFQIDPTSRRIYVNVPNAREVAVVDRTLGKQVASWALPDARSNFPMALDAAGGQVIVVTRSPAKLLLLAAGNGGVAAEVNTCGDADDVFLHEKRRRMYVSCGSGQVDVIELSEGAYYSIARVPTVSGARTSLFVPQLDRLFVAVRASGTEPAAVWVFRPIS